jgi:hypothetical protein
LEKVGLQLHSLRQTTANKTGKRADFMVASGYDGMHFIYEHVRTAAQ